jgi:hypothetical protein
VASLVFLDFFAVQVAITPFFTISRSTMLAGILTWQHYHAEFSPAPKWYNKSRSTPHGSEETGSKISPATESKNIKLNGFIIGIAQMQRKIATSSTSMCIFATSRTASRDTNLVKFILQARFHAVIHPFFLIQRHSSAQLIR